MKRKIFSILFAVVLVASFSLVMAAPVVAQTPWYVDEALGTDDGTHGTGPGADAFKTIQYAINDGRVTNGDIINVADGTYSENITINKSLTLQAGSSPVIDGLGTMWVPAVEITAADVTLEGFTIQNFKADASHDWAAVFVNQGDGATIEDNIVLNITCADPLNAPFGMGIDVAANNVDVIGNKVYDVASIGIRIVKATYQPGTETTGILVENNEVYHTGNTGVVFAGRVVNSTIRGNTLYDSSLPTPYNLRICWGLNMTLPPSGITIESNTIYGGYTNVALEGAENITITGNTITGAVPYSLDTSVKGKNIYILDDWLFGTNTLSTNIDITNNDIKDGGYGVRIKNIGATDPSPMAATTTIMFNNISGNTEYGVENNIATDVDATNNWWGATDGPSTSPGSGDKVSANVDYSPWLGAPVVVPSLHYEAALGTGTHVVDATAEADTEATLDVSSETDIYIVKYQSQPFPEEPFPDTSLGKFIDVYFSNPGVVDWPIYVEVSYTDGEVKAAGIGEGSLGLYYYESPDTFHRCSDTDVDTRNNIIWAYMTEEEASYGTPVGGGGSPPVVGGTVLPVNKVSILMPWIGLAVALALAGVFITRFARRKVRS